MRGSTTHVSLVEPGYTAATNGYTSSLRVGISYTSWTAIVTWGVGVTAEIPSWKSTSVSFESHGLLSKTIAS